jgi:hypothetical protein
MAYRPFNLLKIRLHDDIMEVVFSSYLSVLLSQSV